MKNSPIRLLTQKERLVQSRKRGVLELLAQIEQHEKELLELRETLKVGQSRLALAQAELAEAEGEPEEGETVPDEERVIDQAFTFIEHAWSRLAAAHSDGAPYDCDGGIWNMITCWLRPAVVHWNETVTGKFANSTKQRFVDMAIAVVEGNEEEGCLDWFKNEWTPAFRAYQKTMKPYYS